MDIPKKREAWCLSFFGSLTFSEEDGSGNFASFGCCGSNGDLISLAPEDPGDLFGDGFTIAGDNIAIKMSRGIAEPIRGKVSDILTLLATD